MRLLGIPRGLGEYLREVARVARDPALFLWSLYILLVPLYVFPSGLPQPGDVLILIFAPVVLATGRFRPFAASLRPARALFLFTAYVIVSSLFWMLAEGTIDWRPKHGFLLTPLFYIYNVLIFLLAAVLYARYRKRFLWLTLQMVLITVVLMVLLSLVFTRGGSRETLIFNNPNQLGYYAILSASILTLGRKWLGLGTRQAIIGLLAATFLALLSSSKAALGATAILVLVGLVSNPRLIVLAVAGFLLLLTFDNPVVGAVKAAQHRIETDEHEDFFEERGYDRIMNNKEYWVLGAGEGYYKRFKETTVIGDHELHSSAGTLFFCYGVVGLSLFLAFIGRLIQGARLRHIVALLPAAAYGMTHQGLRTTLLWVLFIVFLAVKELDLTARRARVPARRPGLQPNLI